MGGCLERRGQNWGRPGIPPGRCAVTMVDEEILPSLMINPGLPAIRQLPGVVPGRQTSEVVDEIDRIGIGTLLTAISLSSSNL